MRTINILTFVTTLLLAAPARAAETTTYTYDALGRVVAVAHSGSVNNGLSAAYTYDPAGNRTQQTVTGSTNSGGGMAFRQGSGQGAAPAPTGATTTPPAPVIRAAATK